MGVTEITAKSVLRKMKRIDSWFLTFYGMNLYRGCTHNCSYCDGRAEKYYVEGEFGCDVGVKTNAIEILRRELDPARKRVPLKSCFMMLGGGVGDSYQPVEEKYLLARQVLELFDQHHMPVHILTKSTLVERDLDLVLRIHQKRRAMVSMSFSTVDDELAAWLEPGVPLPSVRLRTLAAFKDQGIVCGMFLMPVIPGITDTPEQIERSVKAAAETGLDFIHFSGLTLKEGRQRKHFESVLKVHRPDVLPGYRKIYRGQQWGNAVGAYYTRLGKRFYDIARQYKTPVRVPATVYNDILDEKSRIVVMLDQMDHICQLKGEKSPYGYAAWAISQLEGPVGPHREKLELLKGMNTQTAAVVRDMLETGTSPVYKSLLALEEKGNA